MMHSLATDLHRSGTALIASLVLTIAITAMAASMATLSVNEVTQQTARWHQTNLLLSAESGLNTAHQHLQTNYQVMADVGGALENNGDSTTIDLSAYADAVADPSALNGTTTTAVVTRLSGATPDEAVFHIECTAAQGDPSDPANYLRTRVEATFKPTTINIFQQAMFAIEGYDFSGSAETSSWDSASGAYTDGVSGSSGDLASRGVVYVKPSKLAAGDVRGSVVSNSPITVQGFTYADELSDAGAVTELNLVGGNILNDAYIAGYPSNEKVLTAADSPYHCSAVEISGGYYLRIQGAVELFVDEHIQISPNSGDVAIKYDANSSLTIYQGDYASGTQSSWNNNGGAIGHFEDGTGTDTDGITIAGGSGWSQETYPDHLVVMTELSDNFTMNGNGAFSGVFFAPNASIKFNGTFDFFGSVIAQAFETSSGAGKVNGSFEFHYDENLDDFSLDIDPQLIMGGWRSYSVGYNGH